MTTTPTVEQVRAALRDLWDAEWRVHRVSPGALGMHMRGMPFPDKVGELFATMLGLRWDGQYIVMEKRP